MNIAIFFFTIYCYFTDYSCFFFLITDNNLSNPSFSQVLKKIEQYSVLQSFKVFLGIIFSLFFTIFNMFLQVKKSVD